MNFSLRWPYYFSIKIFTTLFLDLADKLSLFLFLYWLKLFCAFEESEILKTFLRLTKWIFKWTRCENFDLSLLRLNLILPVFYFCYLTFISFLWAFECTPNKLYYWHELNYRRRNKYELLKTKKCLIVERHDEKQKS